MRKCVRRKLTNPRRDGCRSLAWINRSAVSDLEQTQKVAIDWSIGGTSTPIDLTTASLDVTPPQTQCWGSDVGTGEPQKSIPSASRSRQQKRKSPLSNEQTKASLNEQHTLPPSSDWSKLEARKKKPLGVWISSDSPQIKCDVDNRERRLAAEAPTYSSMSIRDPPAERAKRFDEVASAAKQRQAGGREAAPLRFQLAD